MGKASRRQRKNTDSAAPKVVPAPFVGRPFEGLAGETDWVAMREIVPAATAEVALRREAVASAAGVEQVPEAVTVTTVLPGGWPGLHRQDGTLLLALQSTSSSGDASRDLAQALLALVRAEPGTAVPQQPPATFDTPRLQDLLVADAPFEVRVHDGFDFWVTDEGALDAAGRAALQEANESIIPTVKLEAAPSAYWCRVGERTHVRWILPHDEATATDALARLYAAGLLNGADGLGENTRFLGAFRAGGLLAPVWDLDPALEADAYEAALAALAPKLAEAVADDTRLDDVQRRAKNGLLSRQLTLR